MVEKQKDGFMSYLCLVFFSFRTSGFPLNTDRNKHHLKVTRLYLTDSQNRFVTEQTWDVKPRPAGQAFRESSVCEWA